ncbi:MAG: hypothetical protein KJ698_09950, partial [Actinobacteria bacterium]|nr:hypothetical protein [Actinomycetota bacterium]
MSRHHHRSRSRPPSRPGPLGHRRGETPDLLDEVRSLLGAEHPLPLLLLAAAIVDATDHSGSNPFVPQ